MEILPVPLGSTISSRDSTTNKDALLLNCYSEVSARNTVDVVRRFGYLGITQFSAGTARGLFPYLTQPVSVVGTTARLGTSTVLGTVDGTSNYQYTLTGASTGFVLKNNSAAYYYNGTTLAQITDVNYPATTVPGVVQLDNTTYVMTPGARIYNSNVNTPTVWNALNFISATNGPDIGVALSEHLNYIVAFCTNSTSFFYDAANPAGSPLLQNTTAALKIGCASADSVVKTKNTVIWVGQTKQRGRSVYALDGLNATVLSDTYIDRILNGDSLTNVHAYFIEINGHYLYILTLVNSNITLVYDTQTKKWHSWTSSVLGTPIPVAGSSVDPNGLVTIVLPNHSLLPGTVIRAVGTGGAQYLGDFLINVPDNNRITYMQGISSGNGLINSEEINKLAINDGGSATGTNLLGINTITPYVQKYFSGAYYTYVNNIDFILDESTGLLSKVIENVANDNGTMIYMAVRTEAQDNGSNEKKFVSQIEVIGDKIPATAYVGYSDDDFVTYKNFRPVNLQADRSQLRRCGTFRRRAYKIIYFGRQPARFYRIDLAIDKGTM